MTSEALSALLDGECTPSELAGLLEEIERDPGLRVQYSRLCLAREALRGGRAKALHAELAPRIMAALEREPAASKVIPFPPRPAWAWRPVAGLAAAAGLAAVAVLVIWPGAPPAPTAQLFAAQPAASVTPEGVDRHWTELDAENARRLNGYLAAYSQSRARQGLGGTLGHARYAAYTAQPQAQGNDR